MKSKLLFIIISTAVFKTTFVSAFNTKSPIVFQENKGQVHDQNYRARPDVLFSGCDEGLVFHLKNNGISYQLSKVDSWKEEEDRKTKIKQKVIDKNTIYRVDINWLGANTNAIIQKGKALEGFNNYYLENCPNGALNVKSFEDVTYKNIYNGIDLKWYQHNGHLKYDYMVAAGADYKLIRLEFAGATDIMINSKGELIIATPLGNIIEQTPLVKQNGKILKSNWIILDTGRPTKKGSKEAIGLSFEIENLNPKLPFVIDPAVRLWGTYYGGTFDDNGRSCITDASGNVYLAGLANSNVGSVIATLGSHQTSLGGGTDAFIVKFNSSGVRQWGTYYGGIGNEVAYSCCTDPSGNVFVAGETGSGTGTVIASAGAHQTIYGGAGDAFLAKFNQSGVRLWGTYYGGAGLDLAFFCSADALGNVYLTGETQSTNGTSIATPGSHQPTPPGINSDAYLAKFNSSGVRQWGTYYGGSQQDFGHSCVTDISGDVYLAGYTESSTGTVIATAGGHQSVLGGNSDAFLVKFNTSGVRQWGTYYGGVNIERGYCCTTDGLGNVYLAGMTNSGTGTVIATIGSHQPTIGVSYDAYLVKFNASGIRQWGTYYGANADEAAFSCNTDANGNVYFSGFTNSTASSAIATLGSHQTNNGGSIDAFLVKFDAIGVRQWGTFYGGTVTDQGYSCATDVFGNIYLAGQTQTSTGTIIATPASHQSAFGGGSYEAFLVKFSDCVALTPTASVNGTVCSGSTLNFTASITGTATPTYSWSGPNTYTSNVQNPIIASAGTINIGAYTLTINNAGCVETVTTQVTTVNPLPTISVNSGTICSGSNFTLSPSGANTYTIQGGSSVVSPTSNTSYTVIGTSAAGCVSSNTATSNITVNVLPTITVNSGSICSGNSFTISPGGANTYTIQGGFSVVTPTINSSYTVVGTSTAGCISASSATSNIVVNALPIITLVSNSSLICVGQNAILTASGASTYTWNPGGVGISITVSPSVTTIYTVTGTDINGCMSFAIITQSVDACTGIYEFNDQKFELSVYPNPLNESFYVISNAKAHYKIINSLGLMIKAGELTIGKNEIEIRNYAKGLYILNIEDKRRKETIKLIKH